MLLCGECAVNRDALLKLELVRTSLNHGLISPAASRAARMAMLSEHVTQHVPAGHHNGFKHALAMETLSSYA
jgi:hypothetical protein